MNTVNLRKNIIALASQPECEEPVVSAYFDMEKPLPALLAEFGAWVWTARKSFEAQNRRQFDRAAANVYNWLKNKSGKCRSAAVFARDGDPQFLMPLQFKVPMETYFQADKLPAIYPLVEIKDRFKRFVVVLINQDCARIIAMNLGETPVEILTERSEVAERRGREWTPEHSLNHNREGDKKFINEKVSIIEQLMAKRGNNALLISGEARYVSQLVEALPKALQEKRVDQIHTGVRDERLRSILEDAIGSSLAVADGESETAVKGLVRAYRTNRCATFGVSSTTSALQMGQADRLIISRVLRHEDREVLVRLASQHGIPIETVRGSLLLDAQGGVGALLRHSKQSYEYELRKEHPLVRAS